MCLLASLVSCLPCFAGESQVSHVLSPCPCNHPIAPCRLQPRLFGALAAICFGSARNSALLARDLSLSYLSRFIAGQREAPDTAQAHLFAERFPRACWEQAQQFFEKLH